MDPLNSYPFLKAALEDMQLVSEATSRGIGTPRHIVSLLHDAIEFMLYESLLVLDQDIYRNGQNTIGLNEAIGLSKTVGIDLPLPGTIRIIQKHRGDAKHHAQTPQQTAFTKMMGEFRIIASRIVHERFGEILASELPGLGLLPYHVALYDSYRKYRTHNWNLALRFAIAALLHKHRVVIGSLDSYSDLDLNDPDANLATLSKEVSEANYPPAPKDAMESLKNLPDSLKNLLALGKTREAAEAAGHGYATLDEVLPGIFDIKEARRFTDRLVQPASLNIRRAMSWSKWQSGDTPAKRQAGRDLIDLLKQSPALVETFGEPFYEDDEDRYWRWWEFAVFDGERWHTFHMDDHFSLSLESGGLSDEDSVIRDLVAKVILAEFKHAAGGQSN